MLDELLSLALIGTAHSTTGTVALPTQLEESASTIQHLSAEQSLLSKAALLNAFLRCGNKPATGATLPAVAEANDLPCCSTRASDLLADLLRDREKPLIASWLAFAIRANQRAPHRLLPELLDFAIREKSLRDAVISVVGARGQWLMSQNPDWTFTADNSLSDHEQWETGTPPQRVIILRQMREKNPTHARESLQKTWKDDPADQRIEFLKLFRIGLSPADEPLLEACLDDRSKGVRAAAADLLGRLPTSGFVQRMIARATPLITFKRGLLKGTKLEVTLPAELDTAAQRDIVEKTAPQGTGEKQGWLTQILSYVPLHTWTKSSGLSPGDFIAAALKNDFAKTIIDGLNAAAQRLPDAKWIEPLLRHQLNENGRLNPALLNALPPQQFLSFASNVLQEKQAGLPACSDLINNENVPLDVPTGRLWIKTVARLIEPGSRETWATLYHLPGQCQMRLPPILRPEIESLWSTEREPWNQHSSSIEKLLKVLETRQQIEKEFSA